MSWAGMWIAGSALAVCAAAIAGCSGGVGATHDVARPGQNQRQQRSQEHSQTQRNPRQHNARPVVCVTRGARIQAALAARSAARVGENRNGARGKDVPVSYVWVNASLPVANLAAHTKRAGHAPIWVVTEDLAQSHLDTRIRTASPATPAPPTFLGECVPARRAFVATRVPPSILRDPGCTDHMRSRATTAGTLVAQLKRAGSDSRPKALCGSKLTVALHGAASRGQTVYWRDAGGDLCEAWKFERDPKAQKPGSLRRIVGARRPLAFSYKLTPTGIHLSGPARCEQSFAITGDDAESLHFGGGRWFLSHKSCRSAATNKHAPPGCVSMLAAATDMKGSNAHALSSRIGWGKTLGIAAFAQNTVYWRFGGARTATCQAWTFAPVRSDAMRGQLRRDSRGGVVPLALDYRIVGDAVTLSRAGELSQCKQSQTLVGHSAASIEFTGGTWHLSRRSCISTRPPRTPPRGCATGLAATTVARPARTNRLRRVMRSGGSIYVANSGTCQRWRFNARTKTMWSGRRRSDSTSYDYTYDGRRLQLGGPHWSTRQGRAVGGIGHFVTVTITDTTGSFVLAGGVPWYLDRRTCQRAATHR